MRKTITVAGAFLAYTVLFALLVMIYFDGVPGRNQNIGTTIRPGEGADLRKIEIRTCSGEGDLFLYEGNDPFQDLDTSFENSGNQVLIFTRDDLKNVDVEVNGRKVSPEKLNENVFSFNASFGASISIEGESEKGARSIQGFLCQNSSDPVYKTDTFQFVLDDQRSNEMFLTPGEYDYAFFDKYSINAPGTEPDMRKLTVKIEAEGVVVKEKTYEHPYPEGSQGAVVDSFTVSRQGNYTLSVDSEDSIYWALVECPICGDGEKEGEEQCDEGGSNGDECQAEYGQECSYCSNDCQLLELDGPFCGDGQTNGTEQCDSGSDNGEVCPPAYGGECSYCSVNCQNVTVGGSSCGDGTVDEGEQCDEGQNNGEGCSPEPGQQCSYCSSTCQTVVNEGVYCGDGTVNQDSEQCDDGNNKNGDKCSAECKIEQEEKKEEKKVEKERDCKGSIGNYVWEDANKDGVQDDNEKGLENIRMKLKWAGPNDDLGDSDDEEYRTDTDHKGEYIFEDLCEGKYEVVVKEEDVASYTQTYDPDGDKDNETKVKLESDNDDHTKADFGYQKNKVAPAAGVNILAILMISTSLTAVILLAYELIRKMKKSKKKGL